MRKDSQFFLRASGESSLNWRSNCIQKNHNLLFGAFYSFTWLTVLGNNDQEDKVRNNFEIKI